MRMDGELNTLALGLEAEAQSLTQYNYQLREMCIKLRDELFNSGMSLHLVKEATQVINRE
jgi:hypothetical protein